ncbi:hypothetical protein DUNSADRAFT_6885 [Dunaliella salina]|uniref:Secreted protein n=1 Tax=Dunaliella salina TaxID=3046 RepID=A0ABQ7GMG6_DUNSA|nr:hypothetical protein DUNSADRAFT_6885 [Dunaliella salina]|eukprot:KAF5835796.1 hypothetical protein DUNSADRAFT_6885 [Dunaliella salina]
MTLRLMRQVPTTLACCFSARVSLKCSKMQAPCQPGMYSLYRIGKLIMRANLAASGNTSITSTNGLVSTEVVSSAFLMCNLAFASNQKLSAPVRR